MANIRLTTTRKGFLALCAAAFFAASACSDDPKNEPGPEEGAANDFHVAFSSGSESVTAVYLQGLPDLTSGEVSFDKKGFWVDAGRTSRLFPSTDRKTFYSLTYQAGTIDKFSYHGGDHYRNEGRIDASVPLGSKSIRFTKINDQIASVHLVTSVAQFAADNPTQYTKDKITLSIGILDLETMKFTQNINKAIDLALPEALANEGYYISRIDCPQLSNGKLYYGAAVSKRNKNKPTESFDTEKTMTLVLDYPSLANPKVITRDDIAGDTNGYRTPTQHINEQGEILQMVANGEQTYIVKLVNGAYTDFKLDLNATLNATKTGGEGFFYAGNGICYATYEKKWLPEKQRGVDPRGKPSYSSDWGVARIDLNNNTAVNLNVPEDMWLRQYQSSVVRDGKFYIAMAPFSGEGHVHIFDVNSTSPDGVKGAKITSGADQYYIGIY